MQTEANWKQEQVDRYRRQMIESTEFRIAWAKKFELSSEQIKQLEARLARLKDANKTPQQEGE